MKAILEIVTLNVNDVITASGDNCPTDAGSVCSGCVTD